MFTGRLGRSDVVDTATAIAAAPTSSCAGPTNVGIVRDFPMRWE